MALLDTLLPYCNSITIDDEPWGEATPSRNRTITSIQTTSKVWTFALHVVTPPLSFRDNRAFREQLRATNKYNAFTFSLAAAPARLKALYDYGGTMTATQRASVVVASQPSAGTMVLGVSGLPPSQANVFTVGDFIQVGNGVRTVTANVNASGSGTASVPLSEALVSYPSVGTSVKTGMDNIAWVNCYFEQGGYPKIGVSADHSTLGMMTSTSGTFTFVQTRS